jgi:hypothetical protein
VSVFFSGIVCDVESFTDVSITCVTRPRAPENVQTMFIEVLVTGNGRKLTSYTSLLSSLECRLLYMNR